MSVRSRLAICACLLIGAIGWSGGAAASAASAGDAAHLCVLTAGSDARDAGWRTRCLQQRLRDQGWLSQRAVSGRWNAATAAALSRVRTYLAMAKLLDRTVGVAAARPWAIDAGLLHRLGLDIVGPVAAGGSCPRVAVLGDSLTLRGLPELYQALYAAGADAVFVAAHPGRGVLSPARFGDKESSIHAARRLRRLQPTCWVVALGINDVVHGASSPAKAIAKLMGPFLPADRVLWLTQATAAPTGVFANSRLGAWNSALVAAVATRPTMRVADWAGLDLTGLFLADQVHYTAYGSVIRARFVAERLSAEFG